MISSNGTKKLFANNTQNTLNSDRQIQTDIEQNISIKNQQQNSSPRKFSLQMEKNSQRTQTSSSTYLTMLTGASSLLRQANMIGIQRIIKKTFICVRACIRLKKLLLISPGKLNEDKLLYIKKTTIKYQEILKDKLKKWSLGIIQKSVTIIPKSIHNYFKNQGTKIQIDTTKLVLVNSLKFFFESLAYCTHPDVLGVEIKNYLFSQLFLNQKTHFTKFVSSRTAYIQQTSRDLPIQQKGLIVAETLFFFQFAIIIIENANTNPMILKMIISSLQYLYLKYHKSMCNQQYLDKQFVYLKLNELQNNLNINIQEQSNQQLNVIIDGVYSNEEIENVFSARPQFGQKIFSYFNKTMEHLQCALIQ